MKKFLMNYLNTCSKCGNPIAIGDDVYANNQDVVRAGGMICDSCYKSLSGKGKIDVVEETAEDETAVVEESQVMTDPDGNPIERPHVGRNKRN